MLKLEESETDHNDRPLYPHKINKVVILNNPFPDIERRVAIDKDVNETKDNKKRSKMEAVKNFKLLSFGDEAFEQEKEIETYSSKEKESERKKEKGTASTSSKRDKESRIEGRKEKKVDAGEIDEQLEKTPPLKRVKLDSDSEESDYEISMERQKRESIEAKKKKIQDEIKNVKKQYQKEKHGKNKEPEVEVKTTKPENDTIREYLEDKEKYKTKKLPKTNKSLREAHTLELLAKFKNKLSEVKTLSIPDDVAEDKNDDFNGSDPNWLNHTLDFSEGETAILAKDASSKDDDWFDIYDPRNPINKRKRNETNEKLQNKKKT